MRVPLAANLPSSYLPLMNAHNAIPGLDRIRHAARLLDGVAHRTPVLTSSTIDRLSGARLFFKCENLQRVGAFKFRGAYAAVSFRLLEGPLPGVATHSSGNHGQALALTARLLGLPAWIVMPSNAPRVKREAVEGYGATVVPCAPTLADRQNTLARVVRETGAAFIPPYDHPDIVAGQGTAALELHEQVPDLDVIMAPVGGGGLLAGTAIATRAIRTGCRVVGAEPANADDAARSLASGHLEPASACVTIADGLRTTLGELPFRVIRHQVDAILTAREDAIIGAMRLIWERMNLIVEPSCAVPLAAILEHGASVVSGGQAGAGAGAGTWTWAGAGAGAGADAETALGQGQDQHQGQGLGQGVERPIPRIGVILTGGNVDLEQLPWQSESR